MQDRIWFEAYTEEKPHVKWDGLVIPSNEREDSKQYEMDICARGTVLHAIVGGYTNGRYICIPELKVGLGLSKLGDVFWNRSALISTKRLNPVDAGSIACALAAVEKEIDL